MHRRQLGLLGGRIIALTLLLGGSLLLGRSSQFDEPVQLALRALIVLTFISALAVAVLLPRVRRPELLAWFQIAWDLGLVTGLVYLLGGAGSGFSFLYGVVILAAALVIGPRATQVATAAALVLYVSFGLGASNGWIPTLGDPDDLALSVTPDELAFSILRNVVGFILVGLLAGSLASRLRRAGGELREVAASAAGLERLNEDILRSLGSGLLITDLEGAISRINPAGAALLGGEAAALRGRQVGAFVPVEVTADVGRTVHRGEALATRLDGAEFPVGFSCSPLRDAEGHVRGTLVLFSDLTELRQLRDKAERAERLAALGRLSASLAHEIRNPLSSISGSVEMVREADALSDEDRGLLTLVLGEVDRLNDLVGVMLDVGRPRALEPTSVDLSALASDVAAVARRAHRASIVVDGPQDPVRVTGDPAQLRQVAWNLVKNALQFSPHEGEVRLEVGWDETGRPFLSVRDQGPGIAEEDLQHLFDMFYSKRHHGVGLGLALVRQIVDAHRGEITVESAAGEGATFTVHLPPD